MIPDFVWNSRERMFLLSNLQSMGFAIYNDFLFSDWWFDKREAILNARNNICEQCNKRKATIVHHLTYERLGNESLKDVACLCKKCHMEVHGIE